MIVFPTVPWYYYMIQFSQVEYSSFCVDRKKKQERTANTLRRRTHGPATQPAAVLQIPLVVLPRCVVGRRLVPVLVRIDVVVVAAGHLLVGHLRDGIVDLAQEIVGLNLLLDLGQLLVEGLPLLHLLPVILELRLVLLHLRPRRHRKASFVTDGSRYRLPSKHPATCRGRHAKRFLIFSSQQLELN